MKEPREVKRASFRYGYVMGLFVYLNEAGTIEYRHEDFNGIVVTAVINPTESFETFIEERIKIMMDSGSA